jgi:hypothetical protein
MFSNGNTAVEGLLGSVSAGSGGSVLADDLSSLSDQVFDQIEHLRRNRNKDPTATQLAQISVQCIFLEEIAQFAKSSGCRLVRQ